MRRYTSTEKVGQAEPEISDLPVQPGVVASEWIQWTAGPRILWNTTFLVLLILFVVLEKSAAQKHHYFQTFNLMLK